MQCQQGKSWNNWRSQKTVAKIKTDYSGRALPARQLTSKDRDSRFISKTAHAAGRLDNDHHNDTTTSTTTTNSNINNNNMTNARFSAAKRTCKLNNKNNNNNNNHHHIHNSNNSNNNNHNNINSNSSNNNKIQQQQHQQQQQQQTQTQQQQQQHDKCKVLGCMENVHTDSSDHNSSSILQHVIFLLKKRIRSCESLP
ncbi:unnamed protein product [Polarella glacialis]|uniref:Uncharacterized protein n=1 Tax=Polarella glacialis TaxID=89957 RepID=A0A813F2T2_POLGL|nr:unnamed protein product [Polarella glacialis]